MKQMLRRFLLVHNIDPHHCVTVQRQVKLIKVLPEPSDCMRHLSSKRNEPLEYFQNRDCFATAVDELFPAAKLCTVYFVVIAGAPSQSGRPSSHVVEQ